MVEIRFRKFPIDRYSCRYSNYLFSGIRMVQRFVGGACRNFLGTICCGYGSYTRRTTSRYLGHFSIIPNFKWLFKTGWYVDYFVSINNIIAGKLMDIFTDNLRNGRFHQHLRDAFSPLVNRYVDLMESSISQSIIKGFEKERWEIKG